jgi:hypothetical protein
MVELPVMLSQEPLPPKVITAINGSLLVGLLLYDVALDGCYTLSFTICPLWFLISSIKNVIMRPGWQIAILRMSMPLLTLGIAMSTGCLQWMISDANADRVIKACEEFRIVNGQYPKQLDELVPKYLPSVPPAKYCCMGKFFYCNLDGHDCCLLWWSRYGFYRRIYHFDEKRWGNLD